MQFKTPKATTLKSQTQADVLLEGQEETYCVFRGNCVEAHDKQMMYAGGKEITFEVGDRVWL